jgi:uncharacterized protein YqgV (UPF0045/DUF77 family)
MNVQAEISLYPLRTSKLSEAIDSFLGDLEDAGLTAHEGNMSSTLAGDVDNVFAALVRAFKVVASGFQVVLVLKVSNACPLCSPAQGNNADAK